MKIPKLIKLIPYLTPPLIVYLTNLFILLPLGVYTLYSWFDILMHFIGGASIALSSIMILNQCKEEIRIKDNLVNVVIIVALVGLAAIIWEFYEVLTGLDMNLNDTLFDIFMGLLGGLTTALLFGKSVTKE